MSDTQPEVLTYSQFCHRRGYDVDMSHDRLRFPHGISKSQERSNRKAAAHHLNEAIRAMRDYSAAVEAGAVRPPTEQEQTDARLLGHPDHESVKATWRVHVKRLIRRDTTLSEQAAAESILSEKMGGIDPWVAELGLALDACAPDIAAARLRWMRSEKPASLIAA